MGGRLEFLNKKANFIANLYTNFQSIQYKSVWGVFNECINITGTLDKQNQTKIKIISWFITKLQIFQKCILFANFDNWVENRREQKFTKIFSGVKIFENVT